MVVGVFFGLLCLLSAVLAWIDIRHSIIPDWLKSDDRRNREVERSSASAERDVTEPAPSRS
jgi:hypothetical protein